VVGQTVEGRRLAIFRRCGSSVVVVFTTDQQAGCAVWSLYFPIRNGVPRPFGSLALCGNALVQAVVVPALRKPREERGTRGRG
jgi:hypothetical protein